jgi:hypothetical protein
MQTRFAAIAGFLALAISSLVVTPSEAQPVKMGAEEAELIQVTVRVNAVDMSKRLITVTGPLGDTVVVRAAPQVKNLKKVKVGEDITLSYYEEVAVLVRRYDGPPMTTEQVFEKAEQQGMDLDPPTAEIDEVAVQEPGAAGVADTLTVTTTVEAVNLRKRIVTVKGPNDTVRKIKVALSVENLEEIKPGDTISVQVTEAVAVEVQVL